MLIARARNALFTSLSQSGFSRFLILSNDDVLRLETLSLLSSPRRSLFSPLPLFYAFYLFVLFVRLGVLGRFFILASYMMLMLMLIDHDDDDHV